MRRRSSLAIPALLILSTSVAPAQGREREGGREANYAANNVPYDGRFTFARIRFNTAGSGGPFWRQDLKWDHDYPRGERNLMRILSEITALRPYMDGGNIFTLDDPELTRYPVAYLCEPGFWTLNDKESEGLRNYLLKGGFLIVDDFVDDQWINFEEQMRRVLPQGRLVRLDASHPIFDSFFHIQSLEFTHPNWGHAAEFYGIFEDNDPKKRLMVIVNYNNDIGDYWEWSDAGFFPVQLSNEAYKLGVNYIVYGMTR
ncbi:MAG: DUF4159 domain-containing protein [Gemmatimonadaceae bacterium]